MRKELSLKTFLYYIVIVGVCAVLETLWHTLPGIAIATMAGLLLGRWDNEVNK